MDDGTCPLCTEELDPTDCLLASRLCQCRFSVCLWCFRRITEDAAKDFRQALCPNCREPYNIERITKEGRELNPQQLEEVKRKKGKQEEKRKPAVAARPRKDLANVRVVQRNLVYVVGLPMDVCYEEVLSSSDYIGQFGKIVKISVSRSGPYGSLAARNGPTGSAYITFRRIEDARRCIESIHGTTWEGKLVKACYGTTKYCNAFLKGLPCNNSECLYLHDVAAEEDSYTKEETKSTKFVNLVHAASLNQASAVANGQPHGTTSGDLSAAVSGLDVSQPVSESEAHSGPEDENAEVANWPSLPSNAWAAKQASASAAQTVPPTEDAQAWPGLPAGRSGHATSSAEASENECDTQTAKPPLGKVILTMADKIAHANSNPTPSKTAEPRKKLTPLNGRTRQSALLEGQADGSGQDSRPSGHQDCISPPRTPQQTRKELQQERSGAAEGSTENVAGYQAQSPLRSATAPAAASNKANAMQQEVPAGGASKIPPGFSGPSASKPKMMTPPPGFAFGGQEASGHMASPYQSFGSDTSSPAPNIHLLAEHGAAPSLSSSLQSIWGSSSSLDTGGFPRPVHGLPPGYDLPLQPQPRLRSRFRFANDEEVPGPTAVKPQAQQSAAAVEQPRTPEILHHSLGSSLGPSSSILLHGTPYEGFAGGAPLSKGIPDWSSTSSGKNTVGATPGQASAKENEGSLPAGLLLLRKLQAQGGVARQRAVSNDGQTHHGIFQDPAVLSAKTSSDRGQIHFLS